MRRATVIGLVAFLGFGSAVSSADAEEPLPLELLLVRAQASVFKIICRGDAEIRSPRSASAWMTALQVDYDIERRSLDPGVSKCDYFWAKVATDPARFLHASVDRTTRVVKDAVCASGTGFAVSREGILLTNAHVVDDPVGRLDPNDLDTALGLLGEPIQALRDRLAKDFGGDCPPALRPRVWPSLIGWTAAQSTIQGTSHRVEVVLKYDRDWGLVADLWSDYWWNREHAAGPPQPLSVPAEVLESGATLPGKDVAVLRALAPTRRIGVAGLPLEDTMMDRLICLPLGDSDDVLPGTRIVSMGFPTLAFNPALMDPSAMVRVSSREGLISQPKRMKGGWDYFEMAVSNDHGDSGGPVLLQNGDVIALNVGTADNDLKGLTLSVPLNIAKEFLAKARITPDPGPLTHLWEEGLRLYASGRYDAAYEKFSEVRERQERGDSYRFLNSLSPVKGLRSGLPNNPYLISTYLTSTKYTNPAVEEMRNRCLRKMLGAPR
jgi:S1-C subfamily serine protease